MENIGMLFNSHKMKYVYLDEWFSNTDKKEKIFYLFIDFEYILSKYLHTIGYHDVKDMEITDEAVNEFIMELLNLIAHYKKYFYNHMDAMSFCYIGVNNKRHNKDNTLNDMISRIVKIITLIPRIYVYYYDNNEYNFFLKYNLIRTIIVSKQNTGKVPYFVDLGRHNMNELYYKLTKNYYLFRYDQYKIYLYGFEDFRNEFLYNIEEIYINSIISLLPVYEILNEIKINKKVRIDDILLKFIKNHMNEDFNKIEIQLLALKMFTKMHKLESKLIKLNNDLNNMVYSSIMKVVMQNWKYTVKDNSIFNINEILHMPKEKRINIETLMKY